MDIAIQQDVGTSHPREKPPLQSRAGSTQQPIRLQVLPNHLPNLSPCLRSSNMSFRPTLKYRILRFIFLCVIGFASNAEASPAAPDLTVDKTFDRVAGWSIGFSRSLGGCLAAASYEDGTTIWFGFGGVRDTSYLAFTNIKWRSIEVGQSYEVTLRARGLRNWHGLFVGFERDETKGLFAASLKDRFVSDLSEAQGLEIGFRGKSIASLSLVGSTDALHSLIDCQKNLGVTKTATAEPHSATEGGQKNSKSSQGTGFYITQQGHVLTNNHVIDGCTDITVTRLGAPSEKARLVARDSTNDLAILSTDYAPPSVPALTMRTRVGEMVYAYGYPLNGLLATTGNFTIGNVTATAGLGDDTRTLQISAPVQPGNSGGPLLDQYGNVIGVIQAKLDALKLASVTSDLPQNVNFAIKSTVALNFLEANGVSASLDAQTSDRLDGEAIAERSKSFAVRINCH